MEFVYIATCTLIFLVLALLLSKKPKSRGDWLLAGWYLFLLSNVASFYILERGLEGWQLVLEMSDVAVLYYGPLLWFYTRALTESGFRFQWYDIWHLVLPGAATLVLFLPLLWGETVGEPIRNGLVVTKFVSSLAYLSTILWRLRWHRQTIRHVFSFMERVNLNWLSVLVWGLLSLWLIALVSLTLHNFTAARIPHFGGLYTNLAISLFILFLGYYGFRQTTIFVQSRPLEIKPPSPVDALLKSPTVSPSTDAGLKYQKSGLDEATARRYLEQLLTYMDAERPHLDQELTLPKLAEALSIPAYHLSQVINSELQQNFFDFVNSYRVETVQEKIRQHADRQQTLLAIALDCGFNSKAAFNRAFKRMTGQTPSDYERSLSD